MGEAKGVEQHSRDLLQRFTNNHHQTQKRYREESEEIELNLGLSLGGRFGVEPKENMRINKLVRSTSIAGLTTSFLREDDLSATQRHASVSASASASASMFPLFRTSSLPMESEEEWRKRKEVQTMRRMEAKRKRSEKQQKNMNISPNSNSNKLMRDRCSLERNSDENNNNKLPPSPGMPPNWAAATSGNDNGDSVPAAAVEVFVPPSSQGSKGSQTHGGSTSSCVSDFDNRVVQGQDNCIEAKSPSSVQSIAVAEPNEQKPVMAPIVPTPMDTKTEVSIKVEVESPSKKQRGADNGITESGMKVMEEMPCVSTKGDGPNGRRIEGFLYQYKKGEEVRIVCVCHGKFLTPAEFVKHAGGGDVTNPLRHIVVSPSPSFL